MEFFEDVTKKVDDGRVIDIVHMDVSTDLIRFGMVGYPGR